MKIKNNKKIKNKKIYWATGLGALGLTSASIAIPVALQNKNSSARNKIAKDNSDTITINSKKDLKVNKNNFKIITENEINQAIKKITDFDENTDPLTYQLPKSIDIQEIQINLNKEKVNPMTGSIHYTYLFENPSDQNPLKPQRGKINGFKQITQTKIDQMIKKFANFDSSTDPLTYQLPKSIEIQGIKVDLNKQKADPITGSVHYTYVFENQSTLKTQPGQISGFKQITENEINQAIKQSADFDGNTDTLTYQLPQSVEIQGIKTNLSKQKVDPITGSVHYTYVFENTDGQNSSVPQKAKIYGFKTNNLNVLDINKVIDHIKENNKDIIKTVNAASFAANPVFGKDLTEIEAQNFGLTLPQETYGTSLSFGHKGINDDGVLDIIIQVKKAGFQREITVPVTLKGITLAKANDRIQKVTDKTAIAPLVKNSKLKYGQILTPTDVVVPTQNGFTFKFKSATPINDDGKTNVTYTVDVNPSIVGTTTKDVTFKVSGFKMKPRFVSVEELKYSSNNGSNMFEAANGDIYFKHGINLKVLKKDEEKFKDAPGWYLNNKQNNRFSQYNSMEIFQAKNGDIYAWGSNSKIQVLRNGETHFQMLNLKYNPNSQDDDDIFANIAFSNVMMQAKNGDIYVMGKNIPLQVLRNGENNFKDAPGSNITDGKGGQIFQASNEDIYAFAPNLPLQVLKNGETDFKVISSNKKDIYNFEEVGGILGQIFEAKNGDIYYIANIDTDLDNLFDIFLLQVKYKDSDTFEYLDINPSLINNISVDSSFKFPKIVQTKNGDIYILGYLRESPGYGGLLVLKNGETDFKDAPGAKNIENSYYLSIFEAANGDVYATAPKFSLQVLKNGETDFKDAHGIKSIKNNNGYNNVFQATNGDIYAFSKGYEKLQVLQNGETDFKDAPGIKSIQNGGYNAVFEAKNGDIYAFSKGYEKLQVLQNGETHFKDAPGSIAINGFLYIFKAKNGDIYIRGINKNSELIVQVLKNE